MRHDFFFRGEVRIVSLVLSPHTTPLVHCRYEEGTEGGGEGKGKRLYHPLHIYQMSSSGVCSTRHFPHCSSKQVLLDSGMFGQKYALITLHLFFPLLLSDGGTISFFKARKLCEWRYVGTESSTLSQFNFKRTNAVAYSMILTTNPTCCDSLSASCFG